MEKIKEINPALACFVASVVFVVFLGFFVDYKDQSLLKFYQSDLRGDLFTAYLTLSGFLYSLKTFILIKMKENVYDKDWYEERIKEQRKNKKSISYYGPLKRLSDLLYLTVIFILSTAVLQFTLGLISHWIAVVICLVFAMASILMLVVSMFLTKANLNYWFEKLEHSKENL